jgi:peptidoglycan/xylan/chitin deacetylase (PgdA/CDA1 family)
VTADTPRYDSIPIFIYHSVRPHIQGESVEQDAFDVTPELLDEELSYIDTHGYTTISPAELLDIIDGNPGPEKPVLLTFDDGWQNQFTYAFPLLAKHRAQATFYVYTSPPDHNATHFMSWDELRALHDAGMTIGDHTTTHPYLWTLPQDAIEHEIAYSKARLDAELGVPVLDFASPYGFITDGIASTTQALGFRSARSTYRGDATAHDDPYRLHGFLVTDSIDDFIHDLTSCTVPERVQ